MAIILIVFKASALLAAALLATRVLRTAPAATRHALWSVTFVGLLALPVLDGAMPSLRVPIPNGWLPVSARPGPAATSPMPGLKFRPTTAATPVAAGAIRPAADDVRAAEAAARRPVFAMPTVSALIRLVWVVGALGAACALMVSLLRVRWLTQTAIEVDDPAWREAADAIGTRLAIRRPARVLVSDAVRTPMAGGVWRPLIFLPSDAASWTAERRDVVLAHELSHIAGGDAMRHLAARLAVGCYWFHPLAWLAARQASLAREQACDEAVLALGVRPSDYARVLLDLAETMAAPRRVIAALPIVERSLLETRVMAILDHGIRPSRLRQSFVPAAAAALLALTLAAAQPAARAVDIESPAPVTSATSIAPIAAHEAPASLPSGRSTFTSAAPATQTALYTTCWVDRDQGNFSGHTNTDERGRILERAGTSSGWNIIQQRFGDLRICMVAEGTAVNERDLPTAWAARAPSVIIETASGGSRARLDIQRQTGGTQTRWRVNDAERPFDAAAQAWRDAVLAVLDRVWEGSALRGQASTLYGDISTLRGEESTLRGEISTLRGDVSTMRGEQSSVRGEESMLRGEISTIQGQLSSLQGQIASERGSISSLEASRYGLMTVDRDRLAAEIKAHQDEIARLEREVRTFDEASRIAALEKQIRALDADGKVAAIEKQIRTFDEAGRIAAIEKQIQALNVDGKSAEIEKRIQALDVDRRSRQIEDRLEEALKRLQQALSAIR